MRLEKVQEVLNGHQIKFDYAEEDGCASIDFLLRGLEYHIWEFPPEDGKGAGVETNLMHAGHMEELEGDYEPELLKMLEVIC